MAASTASRARTRRRRNRVASSASNIEALPGEGDERVLERRAYRRQAADADAGENELAVAVLGPVAVEAREHGRALNLELGQPDALEHLGGEGGVVGLDAQPGRPGGRQLGDGALGQQLAEGHDGDVGTDLLDLGEQVAGEEDGCALGGQLLGEVADLARGRAWVGRACSTSRRWR